jgi:hypothetical protein
MFQFIKRLSIPPASAPIVNAWSLLAIALSACNSSAEVDSFMKLDTEKAAAFNTGGTDCAAKAKSVGEWRTKNSAEYKAMTKKLSERWSKGQPKDVTEKYGETMKANKKAVIDAMIACTKNPAFIKMMDDTKTAE